MDFAPVSDPDHQNPHGFVLDLANNAIVAHSVGPEISKNITLQSMSLYAWVVQGRDSIAQKVRNPAGYLLVELGKIFLCGVFNLD